MKLMIWHKQLIVCVALLLVMALFVQRALFQALDNWDADRGDQSGYLALAIQIAEGRGIAQGNHHPLISILLTPLASRDWRFFSQAKFINVVLASTGLLVVFLFGQRLFGIGPALLATLALSLNLEYIERAARVEPESLLIALYFAAWVAWTLSLSDIRWSIPAGILAGLVYLTKGTGQFFVIGFGVILAVCLLGYKRSPYCRRGVQSSLIALGLYVVVAFPLLFDTWHRFGSPFYNITSAHAMWYDSWDDYYQSSDGAHITISTYWTTHSLEQALTRLGAGIKDLPRVWQAALTIDLNPTVWVPIVLWLIGALLVHLVIRQRLPESDADQKNELNLKQAVITFGILLLPHSLFFAWYTPVSDSPRFHLPLVPGVYLMIGVLWGWTSFSRRTQWPWIGLAVVVALMVGGQSFLGSWVTPASIVLSDYKTNRELIQALEWTQQHTPPYTTVITGPGNIATWQLDGLVRVQPVRGPISTLSDLQQFIQRENASFLILHPNMVKSLRPLLSPLFRVADGQLVYRDLPSGWQKVYPKGIDCTYCIFEVSQP